MISFGLGAGLALGGGLVYLLATSEVGRLLFIALGMFILGVIVIGSALMFQNRQWMKAVFNGPSHITNQVRMPGYPAYPPAMTGPQQPMLPPGQEAAYPWQIIEQPANNNALTDDSPMA